MSVLVSITACNNDKIEVASEVLPRRELSTFKLEKDLSDFANKMTDLDTIKLWIDHSVCEMELQECWEVTKEGGKLWLEMVDREKFDSDTIPFERIEYLPTTDSLGLQHFFKGMEAFGVKKDSKRHSLTISSGHDTLYYKVSGIVETIRFSSRFATILDRVYDNRYMESGLGAVIAVPDSLIEEK